MSQVIEAHHLTIRGMGDIIHSGGFGLQLYPWQGTSQIEPRSDTSEAQGNSVQGGERMGYPTDVRVKSHVLCCGLDGLWGLKTEEPPLGSFERRVIKEVPDKAGELLSCRLFSMHSTTQLFIILDGDASIIPGWSDSPWRFLQQYGCTGSQRIMCLKRYDTVNNKYILELANPLPFGNKLKIEAYNPTDEQQYCYVDLTWVENT